MVLFCFICLGCSGLVGVDSLDSGGVMLVFLMLGVFLYIMLVFLMLGVFLYCRLPIASFGRCGWGLFLFVWA